MKNLQELCANPFPYIVPVIPLPLPTELVKGEHFVLVDLFKSILGSQEGSAQTEVAKGALVKFFWPDPLPLAEQDPQPAPQAAKKKKKKKSKRVDKPRLSALD